MSETGRPLRVLVVTARYLPDLGGIEQHVHETARRIARRGDVELTVLTTDRTGKRPAVADGGGFTVRRVRAYPRHRDYYVAPGLGRVIRGGAYDLVHCQGIHTAVPVLAMQAARRAGLPYLVSLHTGGHSSGLRNRLRAAQWRALGRWLRGAATVVAVSRFERELLAGTGRLNPDRIRVVQNGGDLVAAAAARTAVKVPHRIVSSGRLERYKGHQRVIEALPLVRRAVPDATLRILGAGPYEAALRARVRALGLAQAVSIDYIAPGDRGAMAAALGEAAVFAALSDYEAHPVAVMEALTLGVPVVGLRTAGLADLAEDGLIQGVPADATAADIAACLVASLRGHRPVRADRAGAAGGALTSLPTWDDTAAELTALYRQVCGVPDRAQVRPG
ncbi:MAG TPA: glycosyltransferase family 4 protein [Streptosporangiaceae bacterium]